jgi:TPR repeat protein
MNTDLDGRLKEASRFREAQEHYAKAFKIEEDAFNHDDVKAEHAKADKEFAKAFAIYEELAKAGNTEAIFKQGYCYSAGIGVKQDKAKATECFNKAAEQGHEPAKQALKEIKEQGYLLMSFNYKAEI